MDRKRNMLELYNDVDDERKLEITVTAVNLLNQFPEI